MNINEIVLNKVSSFVKNHYSNQFACLISGSYVDGKNNEFSDIDVLIFTKERRKLFSETLPYKDLIIQAIIIPVQNIQEILWVDYITCKGAYVNMLSKGVILFDNRFFLKDLKNHSKNLQLTGGRPLTHNEVYKARVTITSLLDDIKGGKNIDELFFSIFNLLDTLTNLKLKFSGNWCGSDKHRFRQIKTLDKEFYQNMIDSINELYIQKNKSPLINLVEKEILKYGGLLPYFNILGKTFSEVRLDYLVIEVNSDFNKEKKFIINSIKKIQYLLDNLTCTHTLNYYYFKSSPVGQNKLKQQIYFIIETDKNFINEYLIDRLRFLLKKERLVNLIFPFQFDPKYRFSTDTIYNLIAPSFYKTSKVLLENKDFMFNTDFQIEFSLTLFKELKKKWFKNNMKTFSLFLKYLLDSWLIYSYDDGLSINTTDLLIKKENILKEFDKMFSSQKKELVKTYTENKFVYPEILTELSAINRTKEIKGIPSFKTYLLDNEMTDMEKRKWSLYKESIFRILSTALMDNHYVSFIPFVIQKIEKNSNE